MNRASLVSRFCVRASHRRGAVAVLFCLLLIVIMAFFALSLDLGYICTVKADLQSAVDAGALAGTGVILEGQDNALDTAKRFTELNLTNSGISKDGDNVEVQLGHWDMNSHKFSNGKKPLDAVKVIARIQNASLFFGGVVGKNKFSTEASAVATYRPRDIMLVLDVSGSMNSSRNGVKKIDELRNSVRLFLSYLRSANAKDRVGFTYYSTNAQLGSSLTTDLTRLESQLMAKLTAGGWTDIADGMRLALDEFESRGRNNVSPLIVLLTDGAANMNQPGNIMDRQEAKSRVIQQADAAARLQIPICTMALDSLDTEVDVDLMRRVSEITNSESLHIIAGEQNFGGTDLEEAFKRVAANRPLRIVD